jgi:hypothetical protein
MSLGLQLPADGRSEACPVGQCSERALPSDRAASAFAGKKPAIVAALGTAPARADPAPQAHINITARVRVMRRIFLSSGT